MFCSSLETMKDLFFSYQSNPVCLESCECVFVPCATERLEMCNHSFRTVLLSQEPGKNTVKQNISAYYSNGL